MEAFFKSTRRAKTVAIVCLCCINLIVFSHLTSWGQIKPPEYVARKAVFDTAFFYSSFVREPLKKGMSNKHWAITKFNKTINLGLVSTSSYCSSFGIYCYLVNGFKLPKVNGLAYSWKNPSMLVWHRGLLQIDRELWPKVNLMDAVVCTWSHVEFIAPNPDGNVNYGSDGIITIAGNTRGGKNRGEGVYYPIYRPFWLVSGIYNHFTPYYQKKK